MALLNKKYAYSKIQSEDSDEIKSRRAQFLIYKSLQKADTRRRPSWLRVKMFRLKIKIGKKLRKGFSISSFSSKTDLYRQIASSLKSWLQCKQDSMNIGFHCYVVRDHEALQACPTQVRSTHKRKIVNNILVSSQKIQVTLDQNPASSQLMV